jgi:hypothetical protein
VNYGRRSQRTRAAATHPARRCTPPVRRALRRTSASLVVFTLATLLVACTATQPPVGPTPGAPSFLLGFWHGFIAPIAFVVSIFSDTVRIYAFPNAGVWYDFGYMLGISGFSGGLFAGSRRRT